MIQQQQTTLGLTMGLKQFSMLPDEHSIKWYKKGTKEHKNEKEVEVHSGSVDLQYSKAMGHSNAQSYIFKTLFLYHPHESDSKTSISNNGFFLNIFFTFPTNVITIGPVIFM